MDRRTFLGASAAFAAVMALSGSSVEAAQQASGDGKEIALPPVDRTAGKPLMTCLAERQTNRSLSNEELDLSVLSNVLWAAWGINRENGKHVVPTAMNKQQLEVYAVRGDGVWQYLPKTHAIKRVMAGDQRGKFDGSGCILLYVAPLNDHFAGVHVGSMYQNVGLYCASAGLANCVKHQKHDVLDKDLPFKAGWGTIICHSVAKPR